MKNILVGFTGEKGHGKNTAAEAIARRGFRLFAFADALKKALLSIDPWVNTESGFRRLYDIVSEIGLDEAKNRYPDVRVYLQRIGTEGGRDIFGENCWVDIVKKEARLCGRAAITDVRFPNEDDYVHGDNGFLVSIFNPRVKQDQQSTHASEAHIRFLKHDIVIINDGTIQQLHAKVLVALDDLILRRFDSSVMEFLYTNYAGKQGWRRASFRYIWEGETEFHKSRQWLMRAVDMEKQAPRDFALSDIKKLRLVYAGGDRHLRRELESRLIAS